MGPTPRGKRPVFTVAMIVLGSALAGGGGLHALGAEQVLHADRHAGHFAHREQVLRRPERVLEEQQAGVRVFILKGTPTTALAQDFNRAFNPLVVQTLIPLLKPYGEVLSFDIASLDPPPVRLNPFG